MERPVARDIARQNETASLAIPQGKSVISEQISRKLVAPTPICLENIEGPGTSFCSQSRRKIGIVYESSGEEKNETIIDPAHNVIAARKSDPVILPESRHTVQAALLTPKSVCKKTAVLW
jgi:hypothetical protein